MNVVVGLLVVVALATFLKLGIRRLFRGKGYAQREADARREAKRESEAARKRATKANPPRAPKHTGRTTPKGQRPR